MVVELMLVSVIIMYINYDHVMKASELASKKLSPNYCFVLISLSLSLSLSLYYSSPFLCVVLCSHDSSDHNDIMIVRTLKEIFWIYIKRVYKNIFYSSVMCLLLFTE